MKFIPRFDFSRKSFWMALLVVALLVSAPLYTSQASEISGEITAVDVVGRAIEVNGTRYTLVLQAEIKSASSETLKKMSIADLRAGQYAEFEVSGSVIQSLRVFEEGPPK